jgi:hypothetical protein
MPETKSTETIDKEFKTIEFQFIKRFKKKPTLEGILLLIGFQECPESKLSRDKEEKLDLINLGMLVVLERMGYFKRVKSDTTWPAFEPTEQRAEENKEAIVRKGIVDYFRNYSW